MSLFPTIRVSTVMILAAAMNSDAFQTADDAIAGLRRRDPDAIATVMGRYQLRLYRFLLRIVKEPAAAEDLFQQTWLRIIEKIAQYDARRSFETWMFSIAHHLAIDYLRRLRGTSLDEPDEYGVAPVERLASDVQDALEKLLEYERGEMLAAAVSELPAIHREVISLRFDEDMKLDEIAEVLGIPLSTVKSRLFRSLDHLRVILESRLPGGGR